MADLVASLPAETVEKLAEATHEVRVNRLRQDSPTVAPSLSDHDEQELERQIADIHDRSVLTMQEIFVALSKGRVFGWEKLANNASAKERREWADRLPDDIAGLQLVLDICKTQRLQRVTSEAN